MKIDLSCPVELWQFSTPTPEEPECTFVLNNLSEKVVISVQVTLICHDREKNLLFRQIERIQGLSAGVGERFSIMLLPSQWQDVAGVELVIEKVWFDDATIWRRGSGSLTEYQPNNLPPGRALDELRFVAGKDAVGYPQRQTHVWVCICGRPNPKHSLRCCRCGRGLETVLASYQKANVDQLIAIHEQKLLDIAKKAREDASKLAQEREEAIRQQEREKKRRLGWTIGLACALVAAVVVLAWGLPALRFGRAQELLAQGKYGEARAAFSALGDSARTREEMLRCDYLEAKGWMEAGDLEGLQKAAAVFAAQGDFEDSHALWQQCGYQIGAMELEAGAYEAAAESFRQLGEYRDSPDRLKETIYRQAEQLMASDAIVAAQVLFRGLGEYGDAQAKVLECQYRLGSAAQAAQDWEAALGYYEAIPDYQDVAQRMRMAYYALAEQRLAQEAFEEAGKLYLKAGDYEDAQLKANDSLYQLARETMEAGDYAKAAELFGEIVPYLDSEGQRFECIYQQGEALFQAQDFAGARALFASIPQHRDAPDRVKECDYRMAQQHMEQGRFSEALDLLDPLGNYLDSVRKAQECRYRIGQNAFAQQDYAAAREAFAALGKYQDAPQRLESATYELAKQYKESGDTDQALALLSPLPKGGDAQELLSEIAYGQAMAKKEAGSLEEAAALFETLGEYKDAKAQYQACQYERALLLRSQGKLAEAGALFLTLGSYLDAAQQGQAAYQQAFGNVADPAREAFEHKDYRAAYEILKDFSMEGLPQQYADLPELRDQACYLYAEELYGQGKPYEALPYYQAIPGYRDVAEKKLARRAYLILGTWESNTGKIAVFRTDGTCNLMGQELAFHVDSYSLLTGQDPQALVLTHKLTVLTREAMTLREVAQGGSIYKFTHISDQQPAPQATPAPTLANPFEEMLVQEEDNATPIL